jgi:hypothetical protein
MKLNPMFTERSLRRHPAVIKAFTGLPAGAFWDLIEKIKAQLPTHEEQRLGRAARQRALGGGRDFDQPLVIRVALVLTYLRLHIPQEAVARLYGATQSDVSRELRRLLPVIRQVLPCPEVWEQMAEGDAVAPEQCLVLEQLSDGRALIDATEQRISRPTDSERRKEHYSGKKKLHAQDPNRDRRQPSDCGHQRSHSRQDARQEVERSTADRGALARWL